jgi:hypothetical protein
LADALKRELGTDAAIAMLQHVLRARGEQDERAGVFLDGTSVAR